MLEQIRVFIADDHELVRYALRTLLDAEPDMLVVGEAAGADEAVDGCAETSPDVVVLDLRGPDDAGVSACRRITEVCKDTSVLVLTSIEDDDEVYAVLAAGACGYLLKDTRPERVVHAIRSVADGQSVFDASVASRLISNRAQAGSRGNGEPLSEREMEVLQLMSKGLSNKEIGRALWIGETTVKTHVSHILKKLGQSDRTGAVLAGVKAGLIKLDR